MSIRPSFSLALALLLCAALSVAQDRPWIFRGKSLPGPTPKVSAVAGGVVVYDKGAMRSIDHGATLDTISGLRGEFCDFVDFMGGITFCVTYDAASRMAWAHFSQGGNSWSTVDSMANVARPTSLVAGATEWFMATENGSTIYRVGDVTSTIKGPSSDPLRQLLLVGTTLVANVAGKQISYTSDLGQSWKTIAAPGIGVLHAVNGSLYASSTLGVKKIDLEQGTIADVGIWNSKSGNVPATLDLDSYLGKLHTIAADSAYQMYRLDPTDNTWTPLAYPLPCRKAAEGPSLMAIEAGWVIAAISVTDGKADTSGIYAYDLNDFTSVSDISHGAVRFEALLLDRDAEIDLGGDVTSCCIADVSGRTVASAPVLPNGRVQVLASCLPVGAYTVIAQKRSAIVIRSILVR
ncbi:MAG: hypothetical protein FGM32_08100 [Candidatus Kapabacteria bacterium]|nr:hypothetical protein [Candidatus Kapabacteria bacterium]